MFSLRRILKARWQIAIRTIAASAVAVGVSTVSASVATAAPKGIVASKYAAIVVDTATGKVLYQANPDARRYPASLTKMMTLYIMFEDLERGRFRLNSELKVSKNAAQQPPSKLGLRAGSTITVEEAIKALVTKSANDASVVIADNLAGSVPAFAERMTRTARALGMSGTRFRNPNGLPDAGQYTTARDMMKLGVALQVRFPSYYKFFQTRSFTFRGRTHGNHNNLLGRVEGVDGIKTGYINASGFNLVSSVKRDGRKIVAVVMGGQSARSRDAHMVQLINAYLPKAVRARGYDEDLIAEVRSAPKVAASAPHPVPAVAAHPLPQARPTLILAPPTVVTTASIPDPAAIQVASAGRTVATTSIPVPIASPVPPIAHGLPSSAAEAFADVAPPSPGQDILGQMIMSADGSAAPVEIASIEQPVALVPPAPVPVAAAPTVAKAERAVTAAPTETTASAPQSGWVIQIGAVGSQDAARELLNRAKTKAGGALSGAAPVTEAFSKGGQTFVRARFAGFDSESQAKRACSALKKSDFACYTLRL